MKALITGISGFTGKHLARLLKAEKIQVTGIDIHKGEYYQADLGDKKRIVEILTKESPDYIFHLASPVLRSPKLVDETLVKNLQVDLFGTVNLIEAAAKLKNKPRMLITGTAAEYGISPSEESFRPPRRCRARRETDNLKPNTSYGLSKMTQELVSRKLAESYGLELIYTRSFLLIGPGQKPGFVINDWCKQLAEDKKTLVTGDLSIRRDFTDVRDGAAAYWLLMRKGKAGERYNVCSGKSRELKEVIKVLKKVVPSEFKVDEDKSRFKNNDPLELFGDNSKLKALGWRAEISLEESLKDIIEYWRV
ncbi:MAG: GDP-mannose 4,6-dehydratase [Patescibacteria group bacterium]|nr:GDP-mannose 4,6-dehydratase [Patescibacteria group bacterium]